MGLEPYHLGVSERPSVVILAGPNGAGKSTAAPFLLGGAPLNVRLFINADEIAADRSPGDPASVAITAGREMLSRLHELAQQRLSFAFETTLASRHFATLAQGIGRQRILRGHSVPLAADA